MRIASLSPAVTEILFDFGMGKQIVCFDQFSNFPEEANANPQMRGHHSVKPDDVREFSPDIVFTGTVIQKNLADDLRAAGLSVIFQDPRSIHDIYESIRQIGAIVSAEPQAEALVLSMQQGFNAVKKKSALLPSRPKIYVEEWPAFAPVGATEGRPSPLRTGPTTAGRPSSLRIGSTSQSRPSNPYVSGNWVPEIVRLAGGTPFPIAPGELSRGVTLQAVLSFNPDLAVLSWCGAGSLADKTLFLKRQGWEDLHVIGSNRVRVIDDSLLNRPGPRLVEGAQRLYGWMFEMLH